MQGWLNYLKGKEIHYSWSMHRTAKTALDTAGAEFMPPHEFAKVVVYCCETGFGMAVVPADRIADLSEIGYLLGACDVRLAKQPELAGLFPDCELGAMPPFGDVFNLPVLVDRELAEKHFIVFNIGTHTDTVRISFEDYRKLVNPLIGRLTVVNAARA